MKITRIIVFIALLASTLTGTSQTTLVFKQKPYISADMAPIRLIDPVSNPTTGYVLRKNKVRLVYTRQERSDVDGATLWTFEVEYKIYPYNTTAPSTTHTLTLTYDFANENYVYEDLRVHADVSSADVVVEVISVSETGTAPDDIELRLETETVAYRYMASTAQGYVHYNATAKEIRWMATEGAVEYDVEWVHIDEEADEPYTNFSGSSSDAKPFEFKEPVRIRTQGNSFYLDPVYPTGILYFRVRPVGVWVQNVDGDYSHVKLGTWGYRKSPTDNSLASHSISTSFEEARNWQYVATYAEEGKNKRVMSYYDGSLRNRQSLTNLSTQSVTLAAEQVYDFEGRPAVSILPAPLTTNTLTYVANLNKYDASTTFSAANFDGQNGVGLYESATGSAARYYSPNNEFLSSPHAKYIPDADGYVYAQTVFTRDNTGRVSMAGGVGQTFAIGSGHETHYYYGTPSDVELYRLFGTNVGKSSHYKKNMVMDPNGQLSVAYLDQEGRTIATALAGEGTDNLVDLESNASTEIVVNLAGRNAVDLANGVSVTTQKHLNSIPSTTYEFVYDIAGALFNVNITDPTDPETSTNVCLDCVYKLTITITDPEGALVELNIPGGTATKIEETIAHPNNPACTTATYTPAEMPLNFSASFDSIGTYTITKKLEVLVDANDLLSKAATALGEFGITEQSLIAQYLQNADTVNCDITCYDRAKTKAKLLHPGYTPTQIEAIVPDIMDTMCVRLFNQALAEDDENDCDLLLENLKADVSPLGWMYKSRLSSTFWSAVQNDTKNILAYNAAYYRNPDNWDDAFADDLVEYHREYCHWEHCETFNATREYDISSYLLVSGWTQAETDGFADPDSENTVSTATDQDPIANTNLPIGITVKANDNTTQGFSTSDTYWEAIDWLTRRVFTGQSNATLKSFIDGLTSSNSLGLPYSDEDKWRIFQSTYQDAKNQVLEKIKAANGCAYYNDGLQHVQQQPDLIDPNKQNTLSAQAASFWNSSPADCEDICDQNALFWLDVLNTQSNGAIYASSTNKAAIYQLLYDHCIDNECGIDNPFGLLRSTATGYSTLASTLSGTYGVYLDSLATANYVDSCAGGGGFYYSISPEFQYMINLFNSIGYAACMFVDVNQVDPDFNHLASTTLTDTNHAMYICNLNATGTADFWVNDGYCSLLFYGEDEPVLNIVAITQLKPTDYSPYGATLNQLSQTWEFTLIKGVALTNNGALVDVLIYARCNEEYSSITQPSVEIPLSSDSCFVGLEILEAFRHSTEGEYSFPESSPFSCTFCFEKVLAQEIPCTPYIDSTFMAGLTNTFSFSQAREDCLEIVKAEATRNAKNEWQRLVQQTASQLILDYRKNCLQGADETFTATYSLREYHYTLYYYDQAGNLVQTVPPQGVEPLASTAFPSGVYDQTTMPTHRLLTNYAYNSLNQLVWQSTPDGGETDFWYNSIGQLRFSKNAKQATGDYFSYTKYDEQGRIAEVGEHELSLLSVSDLATKTEDAAWPTIGWEVTQTQYDQALNTQAIAQFKGQQSNLRSRVAATIYLENEKDLASASQDNVITAATHYSYDVHGNVKELVQQQNYWVATGNRFKHMAYSYDLVSGNVKEVAYQAGYYDQFYHRYSYDADNRITQMQTSRDHERWETDAQYQYYLHGPLARTVVGQDQVQGIDYAYTLQGWLKAVNGVAQAVNYDMGLDGHSASSTNPNKWLAADAFGFNLGYYQSDSQKDYKSIEGTDSHILSIGGSSDLNQSSGTYHRLYNGNIGFMATTLPTGTSTPTVLNKYTYDQLNRLKESRSSLETTLAAGMYLGSTANLYRADYLYDANGNIMGLNRFDNAGSTMDVINYTYNQSSGELINNKLASVSDAYNGPGSDLYGTHNYTYDAIGNLTADSGEDIGSIGWSVYGKIKNVNRSGGSLPNLAFGYGADGNRMYKVVKGTGTAPGNAHNWTAQWYVRDASGNVMAIYDETFASTAENAYQSIVTLSELPLYGSSRVGILKGSGQEITEFGATSTSSGFTPYTGTTTTALEDVLSYTVAGDEDLTLGNSGETNTVGITANFEDIYIGYYNGEVSIGEGTVTVGENTYIPLATTVIATMGNGGTLELQGNKVKLTPSKALLLSSTKGIHVVIAAPEVEINSTRTLTQKQYELTNHLGNVLVTISDLKLGQDINSDDIADAYAADVLSYTDYYPFGMPLPGRQFTPSSGNYRYGFNGKELDDDGTGMGGGGNTYDYGFRIYNPAIARFLSVDPLSASYPWYTPYQFAGNKPIWKIDLDGLEEAGSNANQMPANQKEETPPIPDFSLENFFLGWMKDLINWDEIEADSEEEARKVQRENNEKAALALEKAKNIKKNIETLNTVTSLVVPFGSVAEFMAKLGSESSTPATIAVAFVWVSIDFATMGKGSAVSKSDELVTLYRAINKAELEDITKNGFRANPDNTSLATKLFAETAADAYKQGVSRGGEFFLVKVDVPKNVIDDIVNTSRTIDLHITNGRNTYIIYPENISEFNKVITNPQVSSKVAGPPNLNIE